MLKSESRRSSRPARGVLAAAAAAGLVLAGVLPATADAAPEAVTVNPGASLKAALAAVAPGGTITIEPGVYAEDLRITKPVSIVGAGAPGSVVLQSPAKGERKLIDIYNTEHVTLSNLTLDGSTRAADGLTATGIDANSVRDLTLTGITARNFGKNGIAVTAQYIAGVVAAGDISLTDVTVLDNAWAGIAFYSRSQSKEPVSADIPGVTFDGISTVAGNRVGIQFGDPGDTHAVTGPQGAPVNLGTVDFAGNTLSVGMFDTSGVAVGRASTVDSRPITAADVPGVSVLPLLATTTSLGVAPGATVVVDTPVTLTATVVPAVAGTVTIFDGATAIGSGQTVDGAYALERVLPTGAHPLTASFVPATAGDYAPSVSGSVLVTVNARQSVPVEPPAANTDALLDVIAAAGIDVAADTARFEPAEGTANPLHEFDASQPFSGALPWSGGEDSFVDVYAYSTPAFVGTFPVIDGAVQISALDLSRLESGGHHLVFIGQTSQEMAVIALTVVESENVPNPGASTPAPGASTPAPGVSTPAPGISTPVPTRSAPVAVAVPTATSSAGVLAQTGMSSAGTPIVVAVLALGLGAIVVAARRRSSRA